MSDEIRTIGLAMISTAEIRAAVEDTDIPIILTLEQAAELAQCAPQTLRKHVSEGQYKDCVSRGKPLRFWRDKFIKEVMKDNPE